MKILAIDPGYERVGIAILEKEREQKEAVLFSECFKTNKNDKLPIRILEIGKEIKKVIKKYSPEVLAIETLFFTNNQKTAMGVAEARGAIIYECSSSGLKIFEATPLQIKIATTGYGKATKDQMMKMVKILINIDPKPGEPNRGSKNKDSDDELDAIAIGLTAIAHLKIKG